MASGSISLPRVRGRDEQFHQIHGFQSMCNSSGSRFAGINLALSATTSCIVTGVPQLWCPNARSKHTHTHTNNVKKIDTASEVVIAGRVHTETAY